MPPPPRLAPIPDADSQHFWDRAREQELVVQQCQDCGRTQYFPRAICRHCSSEALQWIRSSGEGVVYSCTVSRRPAHPSMENEVPYVVALVDVAEGFRMLTNIVGPDALDVRIGEAVRLCFIEVADGYRLPVFSRQQPLPGDRSINLISIDRIPINPDLDQPT